MIRLGNFVTCVVPMALLLLAAQQIWAEEGESSDEAEESHATQYPHPQPPNMVPYPPEQRYNPEYHFNILPGPKPAFRIAPADQFVTVGQCAQFHCIPACAHHPRVEWKVLNQDGEPIVSDIIRVSNDGFRLSMCNVMDSWDKFEIQCCAFWPYSDQPLKASARLNVRILAAPQIVLAPRKSCKFKWNSRIVLQCSAHGWPLPQTAWMITYRRHGTQIFLKENKEYRDYIKEPTRLIILNMNPNLEGTYVCIAYNKVGNAKAHAYVGFDHTSVRDSQINPILYKVQGLLNNIRRFSRASEQKYHRKATCSMDLMSQFSWTEKNIRDIDAKTMVFEYLVSASSKEHPKESIPGEALNVDYKLLEYMKNNLNCSSNYLTQPDCNRFMDFNMRYATPDGSCNNLKNPTWGQTGQDFQRFLQPQYEDGIGQPQGYQKKRLYCGYPKPSARLVSLHVLSTTSYPEDPAINQMFNYFGQFVTHELTLTPGSSTDRGLQFNTECDKHCHVDLPCFPIPAPIGDPRVRKCLTFKRSAAFCSGGEFSSHKQCIRPREQINQQTSFIDGSVIYGTSCDVIHRLRDLNSREGYMKTSHPVPGHKLDLLPIQVLGVPTACDRNVKAPNVPCFSGGDVRANLFSGLGVHHMMMVREHNRIAHVLYTLNPHWCADKLFFETRRIVAAVFQNIIYKEYLPILIGKSAMKNLVRPYDGYKPDVNAAAWNEFSTAAFRMGHTMISNFYALVDKDFKIFKILGLKDLLFAPHQIAKYDIDMLVRGFMSVGMKSRKCESGSLASQTVDNLFEHTAPQAQDLPALNIQRGRDHGLASYNDFRVFCGLKWADTWEDLQEEIPDEAIEKLKTVYGAPCNIDLFTGMVLEKRVSDSMVGPTATCLLAIQFRETRDGDRFWFENPGVFTRAQVQEIHRYTYSRLVCNTVESINEVQPHGFFFPSQRSDLVPCRELPDINLNAWRDYDKSAKDMPESPCKSQEYSGTGSDRSGGRYERPSGPEGPQSPNAPNRPFYRD